jgi:DNA segregation ATPase FtsK/SpoIIIE, S-DNA-T family
MPEKINKLKSSENQSKKNGQPRKKKPLKVENPFVSVAAFFKNRMFLQSAGLTLFLISVFAGISVISYFQTWDLDDPLFNSSFWELIRNRDIQAVNFAGKLGAYLGFRLVKNGFGISVAFVIIFFAMAGLKLLWPKLSIPLAKIFRVSILGLLWFPATFAWILPDYYGGLYHGVFGMYLNEWLQSVLGSVGSALLLIFVLIIFLLTVGFFKLFTFKMPAFSFKSKNSGSDKNAKKKKTKEPEGDRYNTVEYSVVEDDSIENNESRAATDLSEKKENAIELELENEISPGRMAKQSPSEIDFSIENLPDNKPAEAEKPTEKKPHFQNHNGLDQDYDPRLDLPHFKFPPLDLLNDYGLARINVQKDELEANKNRIVETLNNYKIEIEKIKATIGPTVTLYEIIPAPGIRVSKIKNLEDDIALSLSALGIRIIAPIPGKGTIGIEVPNQNPDIVSMKSVLASARFQESTMELPFGMGKTISNEVFIADLTRMPHILMAGATGQGKSVGLNAVIASLLYKKHPSELKFVMVDPKKVELTLFSKIERHYLAKLPDSEEAIITDTRKVVRTLNSLGIEMDTRYELLKDAQVRNIKEYNQKFLKRKLNPNEGHRFLPYIVLVIDEFADLIMTAGKEIEIPLTRLAQLARAVGIHLIIATQRPSVNIITGSIKANFPARVAFRVISKVDSRTILDSPGADQLIGRGDMLLSTGSDLIRLQCAFIDTPEIDKLTEYIGSQRAFPEAYILPEFADDQDEVIAEFDPDQKDSLFEEAARILVASQQGSTSLLQRKMKIGYNRAGRIIDQLEAAGVVGPFEGSKAREVIIKTESDLEHFLKNLDDKI